MKADRNSKESTIKFLILVASVFWILSITVQIASASPTVAVSFTPQLVTINTPSALTITFTNPDLTAVTDIKFTDIYPSGMVNFLPVTTTNTCGGILTPNDAAAGASLTLTGGSIPAGGKCSISVNVTSAIAGSYTHNLGNVTTNNGNITASSEAALTTILLQPKADLKFSPPSVPVNSPSVLSVTLTNPSSLNITGLVINSNYGAGLVNATPIDFSNTCGGAFTPIAGSSSFMLSGGMIQANESCSAKVKVTSSIAGAYSSNLGIVSTNNAGTVTPVNTSLTTTLLEAPTASLAFSQQSAQVNTPSLLTIELTNRNSTAITGVAFNHTFPTNMINHPTLTNSTNTCGGTLTQSIGVLSLIDGTIPANKNCTVMIYVTTNSAGSYTNNFGSLTTTNAKSSIPSTATLTTVPLAPPSAYLTFSPPSVLVGTPSLLTITFTNPNATEVTEVKFDYNYPLGIVNVNESEANLKNSSCKGALIGAPGGAMLSLNGGVIPANGSCTVAIKVTSSKEGTYNTSIGHVSTNNAGTVSMPISILTTTSNPTTKNHKKNLGEGDVRKLNVDIHGFHAIQTGTQCKAPANAKLVITGVSPDEAVYFVRIKEIASKVLKDKSPTLITHSIASPIAKKSFKPNSIGINESSVLTFELFNPNAMPITGVGFTESYPRGLVNATNASGATTCSRGNVIAQNGGNSVIFTDGTIPSNASCFVSINVTSTKVGSLTYNSDTVLTTADAVATNNYEDVNPIIDNQYCEKNIQYRINAEILNRFDTSGSGIDTGILLAPYKLYFDDQSLAGATSIGPYIGWRNDWTGFSGTAVITAGLGVVPVANGTTTTNIASFSVAFGEVINIVKTDFQMGLLIGIDWTGDKQFIHEGKPWFAISFGTTFLQ